MTQREIKTRYKHAILGFLWMLINPLLQIIVIGFVFQFFVPFNTDNYFLFLFAGLLPWTFFSLSLSKSTPSIVHERNLIQKAKFPREIIPLSIVMSNLTHLIISLILLLLLIFSDKIFLEQLKYSELLSYFFRTMFLIPLILWIVAITIGLSLILSAENVRYRDANFIVQAFVPLWFYGTPIIYTIDLIPSIFRPLFYANPITPIVQLFQFILVKSAPPNYFSVSLSLLSAVLILVIGIKTFHSQSKWFDDWV